MSQREGYVASGAIQHPDWQEPRIDFQPYPFPTYTQKMVELLKLTRVEGNNAFLQQLDPLATAQDLVDERFVRQAIADIGGLGTFGFADAFERSEIFTG